jgi:predicted Fe-S protein YdhL (DUF1289 family)
MRTMKPRMRTSSRSSESFAEAFVVANPCIKLCKFQRDICLGCGRSKAEIKAWKKLDKPERRVVLAQAQMRMLGHALSMPPSG